MSMDYDSHKQHCVTVPRVKDNVEESLKRWRYALEKRGIKDRTSKTMGGRVEDVQIFVGCDRGKRD